MLRTILSESSHKTFYLADRHQSQLRSRLALALIKTTDPLKSSQVLVIETELSTVQPDSWQSVLDLEAGQTLHYFPIWKQSYEALLSGEPQPDELEYILNQVKTVLASGSGICLISSVTPLLFRHPATRVARFIVALSNLPGLNRLILTCHADCHIQDDKSSVTLSSFQDQVADVIISTLTDEIREGKLFTHCEVKATSRSGSKATIQRNIISIGEKYQIQELNQTKKSKFVETGKPVPAALVSSDPDKLIQSTFRLGLRISEKEAKSQVVLPFWKKEVSEAAAIEYIPDEADDWDEEDPDDDLDF